MGGRRPQFSYSQTDPKIREMYDDQGMSLNEIAQHLAIFPMQVKRRLIAMGIEVRDRSEAAILSNRLNRKTRGVGPKKKKGKKSGRKKKEKKSKGRARKADDDGGGRSRSRTEKILQRRRLRRSKRQE